jgi:hypothetical protein
MVVGVRTQTDTKLAYLIDVSSSGVKVGSPLLRLPVGGAVELLVEKGGERVPFTGKVERDDGAQYIDRLKREGNAFFIRIADNRFTDFASDNFFV